MTISKALPESFRGAASGLKVRPAMAGSGLQSHQDCVLETEVQSRAKAERTIDALGATVGEVIDLFEPIQCVNSLAAAGYDAS